MSGSTGNKSFGTIAKSERNLVVFSLSLAEGMLPLVHRIVADIVECQRMLAKLRPEQQDLNRRRRELQWPGRRRRYELQEQLAQLEVRRIEVTTELRNLGVALLDPKQGRVGFPTIVNDRRACFSWKMGEDCVRHWHFADDSNRRRIPSAWLEELSVSSS